MLGQAQDKILAIKELIVLVTYLLTVEYQQITYLTHFFLYIVLWPFLTKTTTSTL